MPNADKKPLKAPTSFRIDQETADKFKEVAKAFSNQDAALNALLAAFEREKLQEANPQFSEDLNMFENYQRCLSAKFVDILKALATADERAKVDMQTLLDSKDTTIADLQTTLEEAKRQKQTYEDLYREAQKEKKVVEDNLHSAQLETERLQRDIQEKTEQHVSILSDKERLNDILSKNVAELQGKIEEYQGYAQQMAEMEGQITSLNAKIRELENANQELEYQHKMELLDKERQFEIEKSDIKAQFDDKQEALRGKYEKEIEKLRQRLEEGQKKG